MNESSSSASRLLTDLRAGSRRALGRLLSLAESAPEQYAAVADDVLRAGRGAPRVGVTGPAGVGKSTLIDALAAELRSRATTVAVLATDPSSETSGGALLGDRVRYSGAEPDPGFYLRSAAHRGASGGLSVAVHDQLDLLDAFGFQMLLIEAVGAGQTEIEIAAASDLTLVVLHPEGGDTVQAMKAGLMEVGDIFVINKADLPGGEHAVAAIETALDLRSGGRGACQVLEVSARERTGIAVLVDTILSELARRESDGETERRRRRRAEHRVRTLVLREVRRRLLSSEALAAALERSPHASPHQLARILVDDAFGDREQGSR